jgi:hypothetical protein
MMSRLACGDYADELVHSGIAIGVHDNQQNESLGEADRVPS